MKRALVILLVATAYYAIIPFFLMFIPMRSFVGPGTAFVFFFAWFFAAVFGVSALACSGKMGWRKLSIERKIGQVIPDNEYGLKPREAKSDSIAIGLIGLLSMCYFFNATIPNIRSVPGINPDATMIILWLTSQLPIGLIGVALFVISVYGFTKWPTKKQLLEQLSPHNCRKCGYNLFGLSEKRCPECGTSFEQSPPETPMN